jgi:hypothetical protein
MNTDISCPNMWGYFTFEKSKSVHIDKLKQLKKKKKKKNNKKNKKKKKKKKIKKPK